ncbi:hypothetical protein JTB14_034267 [Gonioctena quinquepunctata]|nr:hypothetical protein JTB14_034267 [Gonioctena quinquepunctata]
MDKLVTLKIDATATIMPNRVKGFEFKKDNAMNRGESEVAVRTDDKLYITKWKDNTSVLMISTASGREPETEEERWNYKEKNAQAYHAQPLLNHTTKTWGL